MNLRRIITSLSLFFTPGLIFAQTKQKPNIIIILADDLGWGDVGYHGSFIKTPNIDQLSKDGVILNRFYTAPICSPTRVGLMTGRYPNRVGIREATIPPWSDFGLDIREELMPQVLAKAGYTNRALLGKWHLGHNSLQFHPMRRGFTHFYGCLNGAIDYFSQKREGERDWHNDYEMAKETGYSTNLLADEAVKCIKNYAKEKAPFFIYLAFNAPHGPLQAPDNELKLAGYDPSKPRFSGGGEEGEESGNKGHGNTPKQTYTAMVQCMDRGIGRVIQALKDQKIDDNTLVIFMSDNGAAGNGNVNSHGELKGYKFDEWEGGVRVPAIIKWPAGNLKGGKQVEQVMGYIDLLPTFKDLAGISAPDKNPLDGINIWPFLSGEVPKFDRTFYLGHGAILNGDWKLIKDNGIKKMKMTGDVLYKIPPDYAEKKNLKEVDPAKYQELKALVAPFDSIKAEKEILGKGPKKGFKAPENWKITKEKV
jgi:arylsulfatase B